MKKESKRMRWTNKEWKNTGPRNSINRECRKRKEAFSDSICLEVNVKLKSGQMNKTYEMVKFFLETEK